MLLQLSRFFSPLFPSALHLPPWFLESGKPRASTLLEGCPCTQNPFPKLLLHPHFLRFAHYTRRGWNRKCLLLFSHPRCTATDRALGRWTPTSKHPTQAQAPTRLSPGSSRSPCAKRGRGQGFSLLSAQLLWHLFPLASLPKAVSIQLQAQLSSQAPGRGAVPYNSWF